MENFFPSVVADASTFALNNPFAFLIAACLDRGTKSEIIWTIPHDLNSELGHLDVRKVAAMSLTDVDTVVRRLPRKPRYVSDAAQTILELSRLIANEYDGDPRQFMSSCSTEEFQNRLQSIKGVGPGLASMTVQLVLRVYGPVFRFMDLSNLDIKPDVHTRRVLFRLGVIKSKTDEAAVAGARQLDPESPGTLDAPLWWIGHEWCYANGPNCIECPVSAYCDFAGGRVAMAAPSVASVSAEVPAEASARSSRDEGVGRYVHSEFANVEVLYRTLLARLSDAVPDLVPEIDSGGPGWLKFWNTQAGRYARFGVVLKKKTDEIEIYFRGNTHAPNSSDVAAKSVRSAMHRKSGKGFYISTAAQIDSDVISWLSDAS